MLTRREVAVGKFYINDNKQAVREVVEVIDRRWVKFNAYSLTSGRLTRGPHQMCAHDQMIHWADREATPEECATLEHEQANEIFVSADSENADTDMVHDVMKAQTLAEIRHHTPPG